MPKQENFTPAPKEWAETARSIGDSGNYEYLLKHIIRDQAALTGRRVVCGLFLGCATVEDVLESISDKNGVVDIKAGKAGARFTKDSIKVKVEKGSILFSSKGNFLGQRARIFLGKSS